MTIEMSSQSPLIANLKSTYATYVNSPSKAAREGYFARIDEAYRSYHLPFSDALNRSHYIYHAERIAKGTSLLAEPARIYCKRLTEFETELSKFFPTQLKAKVKALGEAHDAFVKAYIPEFIRLNPDWENRSVKLVTVP